MELTPVQFRRFSTSMDILERPPDEITYQHTVFCQTCLPYKNAGQVRVWERKQGAVFLRVEAGAIRKPNENHYIEVGLPYGSRPRLIMAHLNRVAILSGSARIEVEPSLTAFIRRISGRDPNARDIARFKEQLTRFSACNVRMSVDLPDARAYQIQTHIIDTMELWLTKNENQRVLWPAYVELSPRYFESLKNHAVPLDERAIAALANSPMALDAYAWLAQRLYRTTRPQLVTWVNLHNHFGQEFDEIRFFRRNFKNVLKLVSGHYPEAHFELDQRGMTLLASRPPVASRLGIM